VRGPTVDLLGIDDLPLWRHCDTGGHSIDWHRGESRVHVFGTLDEGGTMNHKELLKSFRACSDGLDWYDGQDSCDAWRSCQRGDWLLWACAKLGIDRTLIVLAACDCAEPAATYSDDPRVAAAIKTARDWASGEVILEYVRRAADDAADAAYAAANAAAYAAANAAAYAAASAANANDNEAWRKSLATSAKLIRKRIPWRVVKAALEAKEQSVVGG